MRKKLAKKLGERVKLAVPSEAVEQQILAAWLDQIGVLWCAVPNGGARNVVTGAQLKAQGVKRGVPDLLIFSVPKKDPTARGVAVEMKRYRGGSVSPEQRAWHVALKAQGWRVYVARGASAAILWLQALGYGVR